MPRRLNVRVSDGELGALDRASAEMGCSRSQVVRPLVHCFADGGTCMGIGTVAFDYETSHGIVRNLRSIGTLYNQSVAALNTIAKLARESPGDVTAEDALEVLRVVVTEMDWLYYPGQFHEVREVPEKGGKRCPIRSIPGASPRSPGADSRALQRRQAAT
ncbi:hypothetical protein [Olsenella absiana]